MAESYGNPPEPPGALCGSCLKRKGVGLCPYSIAVSGSPQGFWGCFCCCGWETGFPSAGAEKANGWWRHSCAGLPGSMEGGYAAMCICPCTRTPVKSTTCCSAASGCWWWKPSMWEEKSPETAGSSGRLWAPEPTGCTIPSCKTRPMWTMCGIICGKPAWRGCRCRGL